jgi:PPE-repeat protein
MAFDFAARPPEMNSALMYSGSGAGPLMAASSSFSALSSELSSNAASYESIISQLGSEWTGPSSTAMAASAQTYIGWLTTTSGQLQDAATAATSSAAAYEAAHAATIPPAVVTANRVQLAALVATNILGQNTPAIAANEAMYGEFWAQDAAAMYGYSAAASAASSALTPLTDPTENTNRAGQGLQAAAVSNAVAGNGTSATLNNTLGSLQSAVGAAASPAQSLTPPFQTLLANVPILSALNGLLGVPIVGNTIYNVGVTLAWNSAMMTATLPLLGHFVGGAPFGFTIGDATPLGAGLGFGTTLAGAQAPIGGAMAAGMGEASSVGGLSVPAGWSAATPATTVGDATLAGTGWTAAADEGAGMGGAPGIMPGMASAGGKSGMGLAGPRYGVKPKVMPKQVFV